MKIITAILLSLIAGNIHAQFPEKDGKVVFEYIDTSKIQHSKAKVWFAQSFRNAKEVIQVDEPNLIVGKGNFDFTQAMVPFLIRFSVRVDIKEDRYRIQFYDITYREGTRGAEKDLEILNEKKGRDKLKGNIYSEFTSLIESFKKSVSQANDF